MAVYERTRDLIRQPLRAVGMDLIRWSPESSLEAALARMLRFHNVDTVLDVGANEGQYALSVRRLGYCGHIISFEPLTVPYQRLEKCAANDPSWTVAPRMALGDHEGEVSMNVASNGGASSSVFRMLETHERAAPDVRYIGSEVVKISRLDYVIGKLLKSDKGNIFLKVDVQGYELQVLDGATALLDHVVGAQLEVSTVRLYEGQPTLPKVSEYMTSRGFEIWGIIPGFTDNLSGRMLQADVIFFR